MILNKKLQKFCEFNSMFGRKIIKLTKKFGKVTKTEVTFNTDHVSFYNIHINPDSLCLYSVGIFTGNNNTVNNSDNNSDNNTDDDTEHNNDIHSINQQLEEINNEYNDEEETGSIS